MLRLEWVAYRFQDCLLDHYLLLIKWRASKQPSVLQSKQSVFKSESYSVSMIRWRRYGEVDEDISTGDEAGFQWSEQVEWYFASLPSKIITSEFISLFCITHVSFVRCVFSVPFSLSTSEVQTKSLVSSFPGFTSTQRNSMDMNTTGVDLLWSGQILGAAVPQHWRTSRSTEWYESITKKYMWA